MDFVRVIRNNELDGVSAVRSLSRLRARWLREVILLLALGCMVSGCAYFNTFYHARKFYREAESKRIEAEREGRDRGEAKGLYEKSIKKCAKLIVEYPDSKWMDDALLMMGNSFYYRQEYMRALRKYNELITYYQGSPFLDEAQWMSGLAELEMGNVEKARTVFRRVADESQDPGRRVKAQVMLARSWEAVGRFDRCVEEIGGLVEDDGEDDQDLSLYMTLGDCYRAGGRLAEARPMYERAADVAKYPAQEFEAQLRVADCYKELGEIDRARALYSRLLEKESSPVRLGRLKLATARLLITLGQPVEAIELLEEVVEDRGMGGLSGEAQFEIGLAYEQVLQDREMAVEAYGLVDKNRPAPEIAKRAGTRKQNLNRLAGLLDQREAVSPDSVPLITFKIAEHYLFIMDEPARAVEQYEVLTGDGADQALAPKALLAVAWVRQYVDEDSAGAAEVYDRLVELFPETEYADLAREELGLPPREIPVPVDTLVIEGPMLPAPEDLLGEGAPADSLGGARISEVAPADTLAPGRSGSVKGREGSEGPQLPGHPAREAGPTAQGADSLQASAGPRADSLQSTSEIEGTRPLDLDGDLGTGAAPDTEAAPGVAAGDSSGPPRPQGEGVRDSFAPHRPPGEADADSLGPPLPQGSVARDTMSAPHPAEDADSPSSSLEKEDDVDPAGSE